MSRGFLARSESGAAPRCDRGGWGALCSVGIGLLAPWVIVFCFLRARASRFATTVHRLDRYTIGLEEWLRRSELHSSGN